MRLRTQRAPSEMNRHISLDTIREAAANIYDAALLRMLLVRLDLPSSKAAAERPDLLLKLETLQPIGSFRDPRSLEPCAVRRLPREQLAQGVWTVSAGNAAQGVALAAQGPELYAVSW